MKRYLPFAIVVVVALVTLVSATLLYRAKRPAVLTMPAGKTGLGAAVHVRGSADAAVTLDEFGDFECPPCGKLSGVISQLEHDYQPQLRVVFHHFPLIVHAHARDAAYAAEAAGLQGRFWEMHDLLYREQPVWSKASDVRTLFNAYAGILRLDVERFKKDMTSDRVKARVDADQGEGTKLGVSGTPTMFLNRRTLDPKSLNPDGLRAAIDAAVKNVKSPP
jgi:protein-disulfide isomerase